MIVLTGRPSPIDLYDLKPDAPVDNRRELTPIRTSLPGLDISELLPLKATIAKQFAVVRSLTFRTRCPATTIFNSCSAGSRRQAGARR